MRKSAFYIFSTQNHNTLFSFSLKSLQAAFWNKSKEFSAKPNADTIGSSSTKKKVNEKVSIELQKEEKGKQSSKGVESKEEEKENLNPTLKLHPKG